MRALQQHMVFMGSERFPDENAYDSYLQQHGACANVQNVESVALR
jgi:secreted Zn-dependent insulinase-like peptidase